MASDWYALLKSEKPWFTPNAFVEDFEVEEKQLFVFKWDNQPIWKVVEHLESQSQGIAGWE